LYESILLATTLVAVTLPFGMQPARPVAVRTSVHASATRPNVIENGSDVVSFPFPAAVTGFGWRPGLTFGPDGSAYFFSASTLFSEPALARLSPDGTYSLASLPSEIPIDGTILYAAGNIWYPTTEGVEKISPDGTRHRYFDIRPHGLEGGPVSTLTVGPDGAITGVAIFYNNNNYSAAGEVGAIFQIAVTGAGAVMTRALSIFPYPGPTVYDRRGRLYLAADPAPNDETVSFIARVNGDGSTTTLQLPAHQALYGGLTSAVSSGDYVYFTATVDTTVPGPNGYLQIFGRIAPDGTITELPMPSSSQIVGLAADHGGNVWLVTYGSTTYLYQYNTYTGHTSGPFEPNLFGNIYYATPFVGPDDNVYLFAQGEYFPNGISVFVRHVQTLEPASLSIPTGQSATFTIFETHFNGPWTAQSLNTSVASVSPGSSATGAFTVRANGPGVTSIAIQDRLGNTSHEVVTTH
jgi:hypothetical protein